jgi:hypothetical protein
MNIIDVGGSEAAQFLASDLELWERVSAEGQAPERFSFPEDMGWKFTGVEEDNSLIALLITHPHKLGLQVHLNIKKVWRQRKGGISRLFIEHLRATTSELLVAEVPEKYPEVIGYLKGLGFKLQGGLYTANAFDINTYKED